MHEETGGPKNCHTTDAAWDNHRTKKNECGEELEMQDETIKKILTMLDQQNLRETFDENDTASEINKSPVFSQAFKDNMRAMVASRFGAEAAEQFIEDTADMYETSEVENPETAERMSQAKPAAPAAEVHWAQRVRQKQRECRKFANCSQSRRKKSFSNGLPVPRQYLSLHLRDLQYIKSAMCRQQDCRVSVLSRRRRRSIPR